MIPDEIKNLPDNPEYESDFTDDEIQDMRDIEGEVKYEREKCEKINESTEKR